MSCIFCTEIKQGTPNIFLQNELWVARFDMMPLVPGHVEILPKAHIERTYWLTDKHYASMGVFTKQVMDRLVSWNIGHFYSKHLLDYAAQNPLSQRMINDAISSGLNDQWTPEGWIIEMADGVLAGQSVPHLHQHIIPLTKELVEARKLDLRFHVRLLFPDDLYVRTMLGN
jgi:diadenosine tetraphosphate (Ap4A) HIT family hydrolase